jgi:uncharacterized protein YbdZ (MbtH family)
MLQVPIYSDTKIRVNGFLSAVDRGSNWSIWNKTKPVKATTKVVIKKPSKSKYLGRVPKNWKDPKPPVRQH